MPLETTGAAPPEDVMDPASFPFEFTPNNFSSRPTNTKKLEISVVGVHGAPEGIYLKITEPQPHDRQDETGNPYYYIYLS